MGGRGTESRTSSECSHSRWGRLWAGLCPELQNRGKTHVCVCTITSNDLKPKHHVDSNQHLFSHGAVLSVIRVREKKLMLNRPPPSRPLRGHSFSLPSPFPCGSLSGLWARRPLGRAGHMVEGRKLGRCQASYPSASNGSSGQWLLLLCGPESSFLPGGPLASPATSWVPLIPPPQGSSSSPASDNLQLPHDPFFGHICSSISMTKSLR